MLKVIPESKTADVFQDIDNKIYNNITVNNDEDIIQDFLLRI